MAICAYLTPLPGSPVSLTPAWRGAWVTLPGTCPQGTLTAMYQDKRLPCRGEKVTGEPMNLPEESHARYSFLIFDGPPCKTGDRKAGFHPPWQVSDLIVRVKEGDLKTGPVRQD